MTRALVLLSLALWVSGCEIIMAWDAAKAEDRCTGPNAKIPSNRYICLGEGQHCDGTTLPCCTDECQDNTGRTHNPLDKPELYLTCDTQRGHPGATGNCVKKPGGGGGDGGATTSPDDPCGAQGTWKFTCPDLTQSCGVCPNVPGGSVTLTIPAAVAKSGGSFPAYGASYTFDVSSCTVTVDYSCSTKGSFHWGTGGTYLDSNYKCATDCSICGSAKCPGVKQ